MASFTVIASSPHLLRYQVESADGSLATRPVGTTADTPASNTLLGDMPAGPLRSIMAKLAAFTWGATGESSINFASPIASARITTTVFSLTTGGATLVAPVGIRYVDSTGNKLQVLGGRDSGVSPSPANVTNAIVEIRFNHSLE